MIQVDLVARKRDTFGKGAMRSLRKEGQTPAVLYGPKVKEPLSLTLNTKSFTKALLNIQRRHALINLDVEGDKRKHVMIKEVQSDPVRDTLVHADFCEVSLTDPVSLKVPLHFTGKAKGVDLGGELHISISEVILSGKVLDIPDEIEIDVTSLSIGDSITCKNLNIPDGVKVFVDEDAVCVSVQHATAAPEPEEAEEEKAAEAGQEETPDTEESPAE